MFSSSEETPSLPLSTSQETRIHSIQLLNLEETQLLHKSISEEIQSLHVSTLEETRSLHLSGNQACKVP